MRRGVSSAAAIVIELGEPYLPVAVLGRKAVDIGFVCPRRHIEMQSEIVHAAVGTRLKESVVVVEGVGIADLFAIDGIAACGILRCEIDGRPDYLEVETVGNLFNLVPFGRRLTWRHIRLYTEVGFVVAQDIPDVRVLFEIGNEVGLVVLLSPSPNHRNIVHIDILEVVLEDIGCFVRPVVEP